MLSNLREGENVMHKKVRKKIPYIKKLVEPSHKNPWALELADTMQTRNSTVAVGRANAVMDTLTGELTEKIAVVAIKKKVDRAEFIKVFEGGISHIFDLNKSAKDLFQAILKIYLDQKMRGEQVYLSPALFKEAGYAKTKQTRTQALNTLLNLGFLREVEEMPHQFWVNPNMFYKGNRLQIFQDYAVEGTPEAAQQDKEITAINARNKQQSLGF